MNLRQLQTLLLTAARAEPPDERVPYAFGQRVMARLTAAPAADALALWARALWRAALPCVAVVCLLAAATWLTPPPAATPADLAEHLEETLLAGTGALEEVW